MKTFFTLLFVTSILSSFIFFPEDTFITTNHFSTENYHNEKPGPDLYPYEWAHLKRTFPYMDADPRAYIDALEEAHQLARETMNKRLAKGKTAAQWEFAGPVNVGGRVVDIEFNLVNPNIIYAGFSTGGVFKSTDTGGSWF
ncbi:MAG: hypothetical protein V3V72_03615, partial [Ignavibacteriaceae bacterium]